MVGKRKSAGTSDDRLQGQFAQLFVCFPEQVGKGFLNVCKMALVIGKEKLVLFVEDRNFNSGGTDVDSESIFFISHESNSFYNKKQSQHIIRQKIRKYNWKKGDVLRKKYKVLVKNGETRREKGRKKKIQALSKTGFACILKIVCPA